MGQANLARLPVLRRTLDGVGPSIGEHDALLEVIEKEYLRYFTPTGKPAGDYAQGQKDLEALTEKTRLLEVASQKTDSLTEKHEEAVAARNTKKKHLGQAHQQETEFVEESRLFDELRQCVERAVARVTKTGTARETAERLARKREDTKVRVRELNAILTETLTGIERTRQRTSSVQDALTFRAKGARNAEEEEGVLRARLRGIDNRVRRARGVTELEALKEWLKRLTGAERRLYEAMTVLNTNTVDGEICHMLGKLEVTAQITWKTWETRATRVAIEVADTILLDEEALESEVHDPISVKALIVVEIPSHARITVFPGDGTDDAGRRARDAENTLIEALANHSVPDIAAARVMAGKNNRAERKRDAANEIIRVILGDEDDAELRTRAEALVESVGGIDTGGLVGTEEKHSEIAAAVEAAGNRTTGARVALEPAWTAQQKTRENLIHEETELRSLGARRGGVTSRLEAVRAGVPDEKIGAAVTEAVTALEKRVAGKDAADEELELVDTAGLEARFGNTRAVATRLMKEYGSLDEELTRLSALFDDRLTGGTCDRLSEARTQLKQAEARQTSRQRAVDAVDLLRKALNRHRAEAQLRYIAPFRERIESLGRLVFGPNLAVEVTPELNIASHILVGETVPFRSLFSGAHEQLSLLGRLACAQLVQPGEGVPLIIDDAPGFTDSEHLAYLGVMLNRVGDGIRTIVLTC